MIQDVVGVVGADLAGYAWTDPLAQAAPGIIRHMNSDHADALRMIAPHFAGEVVDEAAITAVDRLFISASSRLIEFVGRRVAFVREVRDTEDARAVFVEMVRQARSTEAV